MENCIREDREPRPVVELEYTFPHGMPGHANGFYDATVNDLAFADPARGADKKKVCAGLWAGSKLNDLKVPHGGAHTSKVRPRIFWGGERRSEGSVTTAKMNITWTRNE